MSYKIILTCEKTMASNYKGNTAFGFMACLPKSFMPDWLFYRLFCPAAPSNEASRLLQASYGLRKIEAALLADGFSSADIIVIHPDEIDKVITSDTKILGISSNDPLGIGPVTSTYSSPGEARMAFMLRKLMSNPAVKKYKPFTILGGPGAWQLSSYPEERKNLGIDCVLIGEGDVSVPKLFRRILEGETDIKEVIQGEDAKDEDIKDIVNSTVAGLVEVTRGCSRNCAYCIPSIRKMRSLPLDKILREIQLNVANGNSDVILQSEDVLLYKSDGVKVNSQAVIELFEKVYAVSGVENVTAVHASFASVLSAPEVILAIADILDLGGEKHPEIHFQIGIETGSPDLIRKHMGGKVHPFSAEEWPNVVRNGMQLLSSNNIVSVSTIIMGLPGEELEDIKQTLDLVKSLRQYRSQIVPLMFTPLLTTRLERSRNFADENMLPQHHELFTACWDHNLHWLPAIWDRYSHYSKQENPLVTPIIDLAMKVGAPIARRRIRQHAMKKGAFQT
ncbi:B12-binding domain-containing radical SAM protein [bacterium]|nr:B12-binding domain-containing radical SAM protein [bacterium]